MRISFFTFASSFVLLVVLMSINKSASADLESRVGTNPITYDLVCNAQLSYLSPSPNHTPYDLLYYQRFKEAVPGLEQELAQHPDSLAAYVGLMQAEPTRWPAEIKRLRAKIAQQKIGQHEPSPADLFKLGTLRYYQWGQQPPPPHDFTSVTEARMLLREAWLHSHTPIIGLMLGETLRIGSFPTSPQFKGLNSRIINEQLVKELAGGRAYAEYTSAKRSGWDAAPPPVSLVPKQNLRPLFAVVQSLRSFSGRHGGTLKMIDGKPTMVDFPIPESQIVERRYMKEWYDNLVAIVKY